MGASPPTNVWDGEKSIRPDLNVKSPESSRVLVRSLALARLGAHVSPIFFEVAKSLTLVSTNQTVSLEKRRNIHAKLANDPSFLHTGIALHIDPVSRLGRDVAA